MSDDKTTKTCPLCSAILKDTGKEEMDPMLQHMARVYLCPRCEEKVYIWSPPKK